MSVPLIAKIALVTLLLAGSFGDRFIYYPVRYPVGDWNVERAGLGVEDRFIRTQDGLRIHGWWIDRPGARATFLFLHGNGGNLSYCAGVLARLSDRADARVLAIDYRGFGRSEGRPSEEGLYRDAEAAYDELTGPLGARPDEIIVFGHSLGTAVATELVTRRRAAGLLLEAPFTSIRAMVRRSVPFMDPARLVSERYETISKVPKLDLPLLVVHGTRDRTIPFEMGREVFGAAGGAKVFYEVEGAGHLDCSTRGERFYEHVRELIERALPRPEAAEAAGRARLF